MPVSRRTRATSSGTAELLGSRLAFSRCSSTVRAPVYSCDRVFEIEVAWVTAAGEEELLMRRQQGIAVGGHFGGCNEATWVPTYQLHGGGEHAKVRAAAAQYRRQESKRIKKEENHGVAAHTLGNDS